MLLPIPRSVRKSGLGVSGLRPQQGRSHSAPISSPPRGGGSAPPARRAAGRGARALSPRGGQYLPRPAAGSPARRCREAPGCAPRGAAGGHLPGPRLTPCGCQTVRPPWSAGSERRRRLSFGMGGTRAAEGPPPRGPPAALPAPGRACRPQAAAPPGGAAVRAWAAGAGRCGQGGPSPGPLRGVGTSLPGESTPCRKP